MKARLYLIDVQAITCLLFLLQVDLISKQTVCHSGTQVVSYNGGRGFLWRPIRAFINNHKIVFTLVELCSICSKLRIRENNKIIL